MEKGEYHGHTADWIYFKNCGRGTCKAPETSAVCAWWSRKTLFWRTWNWDQQTVPLYDSESDIERARNISEELLEDYRQGEFDEIYIIYTSMVNAMQEEAEILQLLPLKKADFHNVEIPLDVRREELALRPSADAVMNRIVPDYVVGFVYGALVESFSCEQNAVCWRWRQQPTAQRICFMSWISCITVPDRQRLPRRSQR